MNKNEFKPAWWLPGPHLQTLWPTLSGRGRKKIPLQRERIELNDGDFIDLDWCGQGKGPIVLILHGLEGSVNSPYAKGMLQAIIDRGWRGVVMHFRSCSGEPNRLPRSYHSGDTVDIATIIQILHAREPNTALAAIGFSIGGNVLLKWLGEVGKNSQLQAAVAVSVPFELDKVVDKLQKGFSQLYEWHFMQRLRAKMTMKASRKIAPIDLSLIKTLRTIREFDEKITAPLHGFLSAEDYYKKSSSRQFLKSVQVPTLLVHAKDDPFMTVDVIPQTSELSSAITLEILENGGHVGFVGGVPWRPSYWLEQRIPIFLAKIFATAMHNR